MPFVPGSPPPTMPSGSVIFQRTVNAWHQQNLPPYIEFTTFSDQVSSDPVRIIIRTSDGKAYAETIPASRRQKPVEYPGVMLEGPGASQLGFCVNEQHCTGVLGADPFGTAVANPSGLRTIAAAHAFANPYTIVDTQYMDFDGTPVYDLKLEPKRDPLAFRMREIVVDATTYHVWKMIYTEPKNPDRFLVYGFGPVGDMWYLRQTCDALPIKWTNLAVPACTPDVAMMWDYKFPETVPDTYFVSSNASTRTLVIVANSQ